MNADRIKAALIPRPGWSREFTLLIRNDEATACYQQFQARCNEIAPMLHEPDEQFLMAQNVPSCKRRKDSRYVRG